MMNHIDVSSVLRQTLACDLYSNLVTRTTGAAVRTQIEQLVSESRERALTVIDFSQVSMIDFSCADEIVAKLLMRYASDDAPQNAYFLFRGVSDDHWDAIETVLERHGLALALEDDGRVRVVGVLTDDERRAWEATYRIGPADADEVAFATGSDTAHAREALDALCRRRLVMQVDGHYVAVGDRHG
ncbi:MAG TPA: hypothetical protein VL383_07850 [Gemmatimonadaceae bacterium]|jgi:hypothetical protein|nr:hypothetical protein [Gemmatimonadaceae bacterium]